MGKQRSHGLVPHARPLILCHGVQQDSATGNVHLIGVFDSIRPAKTPAYPHRYGEFCVFVQLTDAAGSMVGQVEIVDLDSDELIF